MLVDIECKNNRLCLSLVDKNMETKIIECEYVEQSEYKISSCSSVKDIQNYYAVIRKRYDVFDTKIQIVDHMSMFGNFKSSLSSKENHRLFVENKIDTKLSDELYELLLNYK